MKLKITSFFLLFFTVCSFSQNFGSFASGIKINNTIYNTTASAPVQQIDPSSSALSFDGGNLGVFGQNATCAKITGGEVKTWKNTLGNVCGAVLNWRVYPSGSPSGSFNAVSLSTISECNTGTGIFNDGLGPCGNGDQKWKDYSLNSSFINGLTEGNYILEIYFSYSGSDVSSTTCETTKQINNSGANFKATFAISNPTCNPTVSSTTLCEGDILTLTANPANGIAPYTYNWTGPNSYTSNIQNPTIIATSLNSGVYSLSVTDSCGAVSTIQNTESVVVNPKITPVFDALYPAICYGGISPVLPNLSTNGITGTWNPAVVSNTATGTYIFTPDTGQCANSFSQLIFVVNNVTPSFSFPTTICQGSTPPNLPSTSNNGIVGTWSPSTISNTSSGTYLFIPTSGQCAIPKSVNITVNPVITPSFNIPSSICQGGTSPILPTTSTNGITGNWSPSIVSNTTSGTYTFTHAAGQCATNTTVNITVNPNLLPTFAPIAPICQNSTAPILATTSTNGITGTWSPSTVSNTASGTYIFTPTPGLCATTTTLNVTVNPNVTPTFNPIAPICSGATTPILPTISTNGITGTWSPSVVSNTASGTYTFTPTNGLCATSTTLNVTVNPNITPTFTPIPPVCYGSVPPILPLTSLNGINGSWSPSTVSSTSAGTYTFTPSAGQCATTTTLAITINSITPTFNTTPPICNGSTAPILPLTSLNGITGTWSPATVSNTNSGVYTFTPNAGQCAVNATISITVNTITPTFPSIPAICYGSVSPILPTTSNNGITGTWSPSTISNTASGTYVFTPNPNQCAIPVTINTTVNTIIPTFNSIAPFCENSLAPILPLISINGISGTWAPATVSNTSSGSYTFTPNAGQCATNTTLNVTVTPNTVPEFDLIPPVCYGSTVPALPLTSNNGITGTWLPSTISNTASGNYVFTPTGNICATTISIFIDVNTIVPQFDSIADVCYGSVAPILPLTSDNGITGTWSPAVVSNTTPGIYTFTPNANQCATTSTLNIGINQITPTFDTIAPICENAIAPLLSLVSNNGITGTWIPSIISNSNSGTYTFTPNANQCASITTLSITVTPNIVPVFDPIADICYGSIAPGLPLTSNNGIAGTWLPANISNTNSGSYTFTPNAGICATTSTINVNVNSVIPEFNIISSICENSVAPTLPLISNNSISGTWSPSIVDNVNSGTYIFTPDANQCASPFTVNITVLPNVLPLFDPITDVCYGSTAPVLPLTSTNGITGTWNPSIVSNLANGGYIFTPDANQCATSTSLNINVNTIVPSFDSVPDICYGSTPPVLPLTSTNGITGTWNPATVDNLAAGVYTFTPDANQCATIATLNIGINVITPTFDPIADVCYQSTSPVLPLVSTNGITGTWNPSVVSNIATGTYTFTPDSNQCSKMTTLNINVNIIDPTFNVATSICENATPPVLALISDNGIKGFWSPSTVSNTTSGTYIFTPDANQCALTKTLNIVVNPNVVPTFDAIAPICENSIAPILPAISTNGITGTWIPSIISNTASGTYTFTPDANQCATQQTLNVSVIQNIVPIFTAIAPFCANSPSPVLPLTSDNGIHGTWNPTNVSNLTSATYTFTPDAGICATQQTMNITVIPNEIPVFSIVDILCYGEVNIPTLPLLSDNGIVGTWSPSTVDNMSTGSYTFTPASGICALSKTITITVLPQLSVEFVGGCKNGNYELLVSPLNNSFNPDTAIYEWHHKDGDLIPKATTNILNVTSTIDSSQNVHYPLSYTVTIETVDHCKISSSFDIYDIYCDIQKGISPNNDNNNEYFDLSQLGVKQLEIFNRYGIKVYSKEGYTKEWSGQTDNGNELPDGTYYYVIEFNNGQDSKTGWIYINR